MVRLWARCDAFRRVGHRGPIQPPQCHRLNALESKSTHAGPVCGLLEPVKSLLVQVLGVLVIRLQLLVLLHLVLRPVLLQLTTHRHIIPIGILLCAGW